MANSTCLTGTSISDLLDKADRNLLNLTATIASCPDICTLAWGQGNPDLSGIGVFISYTMQAILTFLCGPILCLTYAALRRPGERDEISEPLSEIIDSFIDTSIAFNIPIGIASAIRMAQSVPFFDQSFSLYLLSMQFYSFMAIVLTSTIFEKRRDKRRDNSTTFFCLWIQFFLLIITSLFQSWNNLRWLSTRQLLESCKRYSQIFPLWIVSEKMWSFSQNIRNSIWFWMSFLGISLCIGALLTPKTLRLLILKKRGKRIETSLEGGYAWVRKNPNLLTAFHIPTTLVMLVWICLLAIGRTKLKATTGTDFQDDQWGFGQIIAVFLWIPLCLEIFKFAMSLVWNRSSLNWVQLIRNKIEKRIREIERRISEIEGDTPRTEGDTPRIDNRTIGEIEAGIEGDTQRINNRTISEIEAGIESDTQRINNRTISEIEARTEGGTQMNDNRSETEAKITIDNQQLVDHPPSVSKPEP